jgi:hypothetical protein
MTSGCVLLIFNPMTQPCWTECADAGQFCNVYSFCHNNCTDGFNGFAIAQGACYLKVQNSLTTAGQQPVRFPDVRPGNFDPTQRTTLGSGKLICLARFLAYQFKTQS